MFRFLSFVAFCATLSLAPYHLLAQEQRSVRCGFLVDSERTRVTKLGEGVQADRPRPDLPEFRDSQSGRFRVHFTTVGDDAVPPADNDGNGTPDYVDEALDILEYSWDLHNQYGAEIEPPLDGDRGGSSAYDVYLLDLSKAGSQGTGLYGVTIPDSLIAGQPTVPWPLFTSWIEADNDYSEFDRNVFGQPVFGTFGIDGLKVTLAHELHHTTQLVKAGDPRVQLMLYEMMAVYMELACYPDIDDWQIQAARLFRSPESFPMAEPSPGNGYPWGWFFEAFNAPGGNGGIIPSIIDNIGSGMRPFPALVAAGGTGDQSLATVYENTLPDFYATGSRGFNNETIARADQLPEISLFVDDPAKAPSTLHAGTLRPFEVRAARWAVPSLSGGSSVSTTVVFTWADTIAFVNSEFEQRKAYTIMVTENPGPNAIPISGTRWGLEIEPADIVAWVTNVATIRPQAPYPQPVILSTSPMVYVPVDAAIPGDQPTVTLMNMQTVGIAQQTNAVEVDGDRLVVPFQIPNDVAPGTYLLSVEVDGTRHLHKVVVKR